MSDLQRRLTGRVKYLRSTYVRNGGRVNEEKSAVLFDEAKETISSLLEKIGRLNQHLSNDNIIFESLTRRSQKRSVNRHE